MKSKLTFRSILFLPFVCFISSPVIAQRSCDRQVFRAETNTWLHKNFLSFAYERGIGISSVTVAVGGGWLGSSEEYLPLDKADSQIDKIDIHNSQTIFPKVPKVNQEHPYLERVKTVYRGALMRVGYSYYFNSRNCARRLTGLYTGIDLLVIKTYEEQTLTYHYRKAKLSYSVTGENKFWTGGVALYLGYQKSFLKDMLVVNGRLQHPFYMPFSDEVNVSSPFAGNRWEVNIGVGLRIKG